MLSEHQISSRSRRSHLNFSVRRPWWGSNFDMTSRSSFPTKMGLKIIKNYGENPSAKYCGRLVSCVTVSYFGAYGDAREFQAAESNVHTRKLAFHSSTDEKWRLGVWASVFWGLHTNLRVVRKPPAVFLYEKLAWSIYMYVREALFW